MNEPSQQITNLPHNDDSYSLNMDDVIQLERADPDYRDIILYLEDNVLPIDIEQRRIVCMESAMYAINDRALYRVHVREGKGGNAQRTVLQLAIPKQLIPLILQNMHESPVSGGHMGIARTIDKVRERCFFPKMCALITQFVKTCEICCQRKQPVKQTRASITPMPVPDGPWIRVSTDFLGRLPKCKNTGNVYVLVFIDYLTKAVELVAVPNAKAETVARAVVERVILRHGAPSYLHSDRGTIYLSRLVAETCKIFHVHKTQTTSFYPSCNGQSERMIDEQHS